MAQIISLLIIMWFLLVGTLRMGAALVITSPQNGATFNEGDQITVRAEPSPGDPNLVYVVFTIGPQDSNNQCLERIVRPPYECSFRIPAGVTSLGIDAMARSRADGQLVFSEEIKVNVRIPGTVLLQGLRVTSDQARMFSEVGDNDQLYIYGQFSDGNERHLEPSASGTTYQTSDPIIATVDSEGLVTSIAPGKAVITVKNGDKQLQIQVIVRLKK